MSRYPVAFSIAVLLAQKKTGRKTPFAQIGWTKRAQADSGMSRALIPIPGSRRSVEPSSVTISKASG